MRSATAARIAFNDRFRRRGRSSGPQQQPEGLTSTMPLWALMLEYDGAPFVGWQRQDNGLSVQAVLETAAARLTGGSPVSTVVAGRTDAGVHAEAQVVLL